MNLLIIILIIFLAISIAPGYYGRSRGWGYYGWSPFGIIVLLILLVLLLGWHL